MLVYIFVLCTSILVASLALSGKSALAIIVVVVVLIVVLILFIGLVGLGCEFLSSVLLPAGLLTQHLIDGSAHLTESRTYDHNLLI